MPWTTRDIVALTLLNHVPAAEVIRLATKCENLTEALEEIGGGRDLFSSADALADIAGTSLARCAALDVQVITWLDAGYPSRLHGLPSQPAVLYVRGTLQNAAPTIAVVGTRTCSLQYGRTVTDTMVRAWCRQGAVIVSGLAAGIDTHAHEACVAMHARTIAVIASGIDRITPNDGRRLADRIVENNGAIVSEYRCGVAALPPYFPARNRIICGLSDAVVVVESKRKGGALITASFAEKYQRPLFAVPGPITSSRSDGTNELIRSKRATALLNADEVLANIRKNASPLDDLSEWTWDLQLVSTNDQHSALGLSPLQLRILEVLQIEPMHVDALAHKCDTTVQDLFGELLALELMMVVEPMPGNRYRVTTTVR